MLTNHFVVNDIEPINTEDTVYSALGKLSSQYLEVLPVVLNNQVVNYVDVYSLSSLSPQMSIKELPLFAPLLPFVTLNQHIINALSQLKTLNMSLLAVLDENGQYLGVIKTKDIVLALSKSLTVKAHGSIIVLKLKPNDYSLSDIVRIIEYGDAKVLGFFTFELPDTNEIELHLKLNTTILRNILATLERYDYRVEAYYNREDMSDDNDLRYENLMKIIDL
jgi:acetoin utilization protein AcuB